MKENKPSIWIRHNVCSFILLWKDLLGEYKIFTPTACDKFNPLPSSNIRNLIWIYNKANSFAAAAYTAPHMNKNQAQCVPIGNRGLL